MQKCILSPNEPLFIGGEKPAEKGGPFLRQLNIFETVKQSVGLRQAASFYGLRIRRDGKALCPFHPDRHPSMQIYDDDHYYCFACGAHGDVIDLTAGLFHLLPADAAKKLAVDFRIDSLNFRDPQLTESPAFPKSDTPASSGKHTWPADSAEKTIHVRRMKAYFAFCDYRQLLLRWKEQLAPTPGETPSDNYCYCCNELSRIEQYLDILQPGSIYPEEDIEKLIFDLENCITYKKTDTEQTVRMKIFRMFASCGMLYEKGLRGGAMK